MKCLKQALVYFPSHWSFTEGVPISWIEASFHCFWGSWNEISYTHMLVFEMHLTSSSPSGIMTLFALVHGIKTGLRFGWSSHVTWPQPRPAWKKCRICRTRVGLSHPRSSKPNLPWLASRIFPLFFPPCCCCCAKLCFRFWYIDSVVTIIRSEKLALAWAAVNLLKQSLAIGGKSFGLKSGQCFWIMAAEIPDFQWPFHSVLFCPQPSFVKRDFFLSEGMYTKGSMIMPELFHAAAIAGEVWNTRTVLSFKENWMFFGTGTIEKEIQLESTDRYR